MSEKVDITYVLKHRESGFYVQDKQGDVFTRSIGRARPWRENYPPDEEFWRKLLESGEYVTVKRTETVTVEFEEVEL